MKQPEQLGPFRILQLLGRGGMGAVYQGIHITTGEPVAVKVLIERFDEETPEARLRFEAEIDALRMLRHPSIVRLNGFGQEDELLYYVMELVCGSSLHKELKKQRGFLWQDVAKIGYDVCLALKHGHDRGITHRDLKPANIMLDNSGVVKIADYGIAHCFGNSRLTGSNAVIGTIEFMAPEQAVAGPVGPKSDLYSLGAVLYALLCRRPPFVAKTLPEIVKKHLSEPLEDISRFRHDAPAELVRIIRHMLERKPEDRPNNAFLVAKRFEELLDAEFGSADSVIVLPSKFDEPPGALPTSDETRTQFVGIRKIVNDDASGENSGESKSFQVQYGVSPDENAITRRKSREDDVTPNEAPDQNNDNGKDGDDAQASKEEPSEIRDDDGSRKSPLSVYHDLTGLHPASGSFSANMTRHTSAFDHLKNDSAELRPEAAHDTLPPETEGAHDNTSVSGHIPTVSLLRPDGTRHISHFTAIGEDELGYRITAADEENRPFISVQVAVLSICLVMLGLWAWWMLQPPSADKLYGAITKNVNPDRLPPRQAAILAAEPNITKFLDLYPRDERVETVLKLHREVELAQMERQLDRLPGLGISDKKLLPVQRAYLEAVSLINTKPDEAVRRLEALITLYETPRFAVSIEQEESENRDTEESSQFSLNQSEPDLTNPTGITVEIARRRLESLQGNIAPIIESQAGQLGLTVERIKLIDKIDPAKATAMRKAALELYSDKPWAKSILARLDSNGDINNAVGTDGQAQ